MIQILLLIDDDEDDHNIFIHELHAYSTEVKVISAFDGAQGLDLLKTIHPTWIFLDINMPKMDGIEVLERIKSSEDFKHVPVYIFSTSDGFKSKPVVLELGAAGYFKKPISFDGFKEMFKQVFNNLKK